MTYQYNSEIRVKEKDLPFDTVSYVIWDRYRGNQMFFLACSWDGFIRYYEVTGRNYDDVIKVW
jgi:hypothetical protein